MNVITYFALKLQEQEQERECFQQGTIDKINLIIPLEFMLICVPTSNSFTKLEGKEASYTYHLLYQNWNAFALKCTNKVLNLFTIC